jgi:hypothetical protein
LAQDVDPHLWGAGLNGTVLAVARSGNTIYLGGLFHSIAPNAGGCIPFDSGTDAPREAYPKVAGFVYAIVSDGFGGWFLGGHFGGVGGLPRANLAHIDSDGHVANWTPDPNGDVLTLTLSGSRLYVGGEFTQIAGVTREYAAAVDVDVGFATPWNPHLDAGVRAILPRGASVFLGGFFGSVDGQPRGGLAEVDRITGRVMAWSPNPDDQVFALASHGDTLYVGGNFSSIAGLPLRYLAAFNLTLGKIMPWDAAISRMPDFIFDGGPGVRALLAGDNSVYVAGAFNRIGGAERQGLAEVEFGTATSTTWNPRAIRSNLAATVSSLSMHGATLYVAGGFDSLGGQPVRSAGAVDIRTGLAHSWQPQLDGIRVVAADGHTVYAGGVFTSFGPEFPRECLAALDARTGRVTDWNPGSNDLVNSIIARDGKVYVGGDFSTVGGQLRTGIAAIDSATGLATDWNPSCGGQVWTLAVTDSLVYAGGSFGSIGGQLRSYLGAIDRGTGAATDWNPSPNDIVTTIVPNGRVIYAGGLFTRAGGAPRICTVALDATTGLATNWVADTDDFVRCMAVGDTTVYVSGYFNHIGGQHHDGIAALSAFTGTPNNWRADASREVKQVMVTGGIVYAGGAFSSIGGKPRECIAALDPTTGEVLDWNPAADGVVWALGTGGNTIYAGGAFHRMGSISSALVAAVSPAPRMPSDDAGAPGGVIRSIGASNPADAMSLIRFSLSDATVVDLSVFDLQGREVKRPLVHESMTAGEHLFQVSTQGWPIGCYFYRIMAGVDVQSLKFIVVH